VGGRNRRLQCFCHRRHRARRGAVFVVPPRTLDQNRLEMGWQRSQSHLFSYDSLGNCEGSSRRAIWWPLPHLHRNDRLVVLIVRKNGGSRRTHGRLVQRKVTVALLVTAVFTGATSVAVAAAKKALVSEIRRNVVGDWNCRTDNGAVFTYDGTVSRSSDSGQLKISIRATTTNYTFTVTGESIKDKDPKRKKRYERSGQATLEGSTLTMRYDDPNKYGLDPLKAEYEVDGLLDPLDAPTIKITSDGNFTNFVKPAMVPLKVSAATTRGFAASYKMSEGTAQRGSERTYRVNCSKSSNSTAPVTLNGDVKPADLLTAEVPACSQTKKQRLVNGQTPKGSKSNSGRLRTTSALLLSGDFADLGYEQITTVYECVSEGKQQPDFLVLIGRNGSLLASLQMQRYPGRSVTTVTAIKRSDIGVGAYVTVEATTAEGTNPLVDNLWVDYRDGNFFVH
jgi:hypothetical protein